MKSPHLPSPSTSRAWSHCISYPPRLCGDNCPPDHWSQRERADGSGRGDPPATTYRLGQSNIQAPLMWDMALVACAMGAVLGISATLILVTAGLLGRILLSPSGAAQKQHRKEGRP